MITLSELTIKNPNFLQAGDLFLTENPMMLGKIIT